MNKQQSIDIVRSTFELPFEKKRFVIFIKELLNHPTDAPFVRQGNLVPDQFKPYISHYERIGKYTTGEHRIDILIVYLKKGSSIAHARSMQRNFISGYLQGNYGTDAAKDAALVAFVSPESADWRFSLVRMEYKLEETAKGGMRAKEEYSPARRWSFLVGPNEKSHTAQSRLVPIIADDDHDPTLTQLEDAFNIEKVTKEFFEKYRNLFIWAKEELDRVVIASSRIQADFDSKKINTVDLAKKLLGQIIFLYYLQKKGWFGVPIDADWGEGSKTFLRELFEKKHGDYKNFFNDILEPLFYEALRMDRSYDGHYYSRFNSKIPFLNGGLFDPMNNYDWVKTDILLSNELFSNKNKTPEGDTGNGILDIFDRYNFTVKEDEPFEKEVAIDPELLGKAYEKFNAIRPDNYEEYLLALKSGKKGEESKFNKQYGVYYTPREIVHYMCQQSLINYLYTELNANIAYQKLDEQQLDAFGNATKNGQLDLVIEHHPAKEEIAKEDIETLILRGDNIKENDTRVVTEGRETRDYPFLMPAAIRRNAALIDEKLAVIKVCDPAVGSGAFPVGMMTEIVKARLALETYTSTTKNVYAFKRDCIETSLYGVDIDSGAVEIAKLRLWLSLVVDEEDPQSIRPLPNLDYKIICGNSLVGVEKNLFNLDLYKQLELLKPLYFNATNPSIKQEKKREIDSLIDQITNGRSQFDFEIYFSEVFHENTGFDVVIANPPYGANIDSFIKVLEKLYPNTAKSHKDSYKIFIELGLSKLASKNGIVVYIVPNTLLRQPRYKDARDFIMKFKILEVLNLGENVFEQAVVPTCVFIVQNCPDKTKQIRFEDFSNKSKFSGEDLIVTRLVDLKDLFTNTGDGCMSNGSTFGTILDFRDAGINYQRVNVGMSEKGKSDLGQRLLYEGEQENQEDVMYWKGEDINAYYVAGKTNRWVRLNTSKRLKKNERVVLNKDYFKRSPKLIWRQTASFPIVAIDTRGIWFGRSIQSAIVKPIYSHFDYRFIVGILNSKYIRWLYNERVKEAGRVFPQVKLEYLKILPFCDVTSDQQAEVIHLVDSLIQLKEINSKADTSELEKRIDSVVYKLYKLTEDEIRMVEGG